MFSLYQDYFLCSSFLFQDLLLCPLKGFILAVWLPLTEPLQYGQLPGSQMHETVTGDFLLLSHISQRRESRGGGYTGVGGGTEVGTVAPMYPGSEAVTGGLLLLSHISPTPDCYSCPNWLSRDSRVNIKAVISSCLTSLLTDNCKPSKGSGILMTTHKNFELWSSPLA